MSRKLQTIVCDMDGTICEQTRGGIAYAKARPRMDVIRKLRLCHKRGNRIVIYTARGMNTYGPIQASNAYWDMTEKWLRRYKVPYDELVFGKPAGDLYVDDKSCTPADFVDFYGEKVAL